MAGVWGRAAEGGRGRKRAGLGERVWRGGERTELLKGQSHARRERGPRERTGTDSQVEVVHHHLVDGLGLPELVQDVH